MVTGRTIEPHDVEVAAGVARDEHDAAIDTMMPSAPATDSSPWPLLLSGLAVGLAIGLVGGGYLTATREFFRTQGWGWIAADKAVQSILRVQ
jgi:hypothetical protein